MMKSMIWIANPSKVLSTKFVLAKLLELQCSSAQNFENVAYDFHICRLYCMPLERIFQWW